MQHARQTARLHCLTTAHLGWLIALAAYPHLRATTRRECWDRVYMLILLAIVAQWVLCRKECLASYAEKRLVDDTYCLGECPYVFPYHHHRLLGHPIVVPMVVAPLTIASVLTVLWRMDSVGVAGKRAALVLLGVVCAYGIYDAARAGCGEGGRCADLERRVCRCVRGASS